MTPDQWIGIFGLLVGLAALGIAFYAIRDVRHLIRRHIIEAQRDMLYIDANHRMSWQLLVPVEARESPETVILIHQFWLVQRELEPSFTQAEAGELLRSEAVATADDLERHGFAKWRDNIDMEAIHKILKERKDGIAGHRLRNMFGGKDRIFS